METLKNTDVQTEDLQADAAGSDLTRKLIRPRGEKLSRRQREEKLKAERVQEKLLSMPGWRPSSDGKGLVKVRVLRDNRTALAYTAYVSTATEGAGHRLHIILSGPRVFMTLQSRARHGGFTESLLDFAKDLG
jgi:pterin-4a-carbinolamine dehydratase